jgi:hypothetical protein
MSAISPGQQVAGARNTAMGGVSRIIDGPFSALNNPATLPFSPDLSIGISHTQHFFLKELSTSTFGVSLPTSLGAFGSYFQQFGIPGMKHNSMGISYGKAFGSVVSAGLTLHYAYLAIEEPYENFSYVTFSAGFLVDLNENFRAMLYVFNPVSRLKMFPNQLILPSLFSLGFSYRKERVLLAAEATKRSGIPPTLSIGLEYSLPKVASLRTGFRLNPFVWSFGTGIEMGPLSLDVSASIHNTLGISPELSIFYQFRKHGK